MIARLALRPLSIGLTLIGFAVAGPIAATSAQDGKKPADPAAKKKGAIPTKAEELMRSALEAAGNEDFAKGADLAEQAAKLEPENRQPLFILSIFTCLGADKAKTDAEKLALLKRSRAAFADLKKRFNPLSPQEQSFLDRDALDEARILALEGKPAPALDILVKIIGGGSDETVQLDEMTEFKAVRALPDYQTRIQEAVAASLKSAFAENKPFPFDFDLKDVDGKPVRLADFKGNVTVVDVWGTWCPPCRKEVPHFIDLVTKYGDKGFRMVGINCNEQGSPAEIKETVKDFVAANKINYPCVLNDEKTEEKIPDFQGYPTTLFLDRTGKVRLKLVGYTPMARLEAIITTLLAEPAAK